MKEKSGNKLLFLIFFLSGSLTLLSQPSKGVLKKNRKQLLKDIQLTNDLLASDSKKQKYTLEQYLAIEVQLKSRKALINTLKVEMIIVEDSLQVLVEKIITYQDDLEKLKDEYARLIRNEYHNKLTASSLHILLSAASLNDAFQRIKYLKQYEEYHKTQLYLIQRQTEKLEAAKKLRERNVKEIKLLFVATERQRFLLIKGKKRILGIYRNLINRKGELLQSLEDKKYASYQLKTELNQTIGKDISNEITLRDLPTNDFNANRGKLSWPVEEGFITQNFGIQKHPTIQNIVIHNNGIDIRTRKGAFVKSVFAGQVVAISNVPRYGRTIIIKHQEYYSVYSKLSDIAIKKGMFVKSGQTIGVVSFSKNDVSELHFEIWHKKQRMNPTFWISNR